MARSIAIDYLQQEAMGKQNTILYIYFDQKNKQSGELVIRSLLKQLLLQLKTLPHDVEVAYAEAKSGNTPSCTDLLSLFVSNVKSFKKVFVMLDALDECYRQREIDEIIEIMGRLSKVSSVKLFSTFRPHLREHLSVRLNFARTAI